MGVTSTFNRILNEVKVRTENMEYIIVITTRTEVIKKNKIEGLRSKREKRISAEN